MSNEPKLSPVQPLFLTVPVPGKPQIYGDTTGRIWFRMLSEKQHEYSAWEELQTTVGLISTSDKLRTGAKDPE